MTEQAEKDPLILNPSPVLDLTQETDVLDLRTLVEGDVRDARFASGEVRNILMRGAAESVGKTLTEEIRKVTWQEVELAEAHAAEFMATRAVEGAKNMESRGFAAIAPSFSDQLVDQGRRTLFSYNGLPSHLSDREGWPSKEQTEVAGLHQLDDFLKLVSSVTRSDGQYVFPDDAEQARSVLENLSFIGKREFDEAVHGLGMLWKTYLDADPKHKLVILRGISDSEKYPGRTKSDSYMIDNVLDTFSDEELKKYHDRVFDNVRAVESEDPENIRIILADDWTISGKQLSRAYQDIVRDSVQSKFRDVIELNLIAASVDRIKDGLEDPMSHPTFHPIKVRAYYQAHPAPKAKFNAHITGLHSTTNIDFGNVIERMQKNLQKTGFIGYRQFRGGFGSSVRL